jgi:hypothetical protein
MEIPMRCDIPECIDEAYAKTNDNPNCQEIDYFVFDHDRFFRHIDPGAI